MVVAGAALSKNHSLLIAAAPETGMFAPYVFGVGVAGFSTGLVMIYHGGDRMFDAELIYENINIKE